jgi:hypothetical protein
MSLEEVREERISRCYGSVWSKDLNWYLRKSSIEIFTILQELLLYSKIVVNASRLLFLGDRWQSPGS